MNPLLPTITLNGTHPDELERGWANVAAKVEDLIAAMRGMEFNGRDYGKAAFSDALFHIGEVERKLIDFAQEVLEVRIHIADTRGNR